MLGRIAALVKYELTGLHISGIQHNRRHQIGRHILHLAIIHRDQRIDKHIFLLCQGELILILVIDFKLTMILALSCGALAQTEKR